MPDPDPKLSSDDGLIVAYLLDGKGSGRQLTWKEIHAWSPDQGLLWVHLNRGSADTRRWLEEGSGLDQIVYEALLAEDTRPRTTPFDNGLMLFLRGVNLHPGADPDDMVSIRLWVEERRIVSVRLRRLLSIDDLRAAIDRGRGPATGAEFIVALSDRLLTRMADVINDIEEAVDQVQETVLTAESTSLRAELLHLRRQIIVLRRYLAPQRDALSRLQQLQLPGFDGRLYSQLREVSDRITRYVEDLDAARDRAALTQEELNNRFTEQLNNRMYVLSLVAGLFLPLGFLTGLLGINVGGIPLANDPWGFLAIVLILLGVGVLELLLFRARRWL
jgi:zinc transporter